MVGGCRVEVLENAARGGAGIGVATVLGQVPLQSPERGELALDAGRYVLSFASDDSHAYPEFNGAPPWEPLAWGVALIGSLTS
jgi:hypothetical protein